jgi:tetratricopeptide (TPR) repeat protein
VLHILIHGIIWGIKAASKASPAEVKGPREVDLLKARLKQLEKDRGARHPSLVTVLGELATVHELVGNLGDANLELRRAAAIMAATPVDQLDAELGPGRAEYVLQRAVRLATRQHGADHATVAQPLAALADLRERQGRLPEAERSLERALQIEQATFGTSHLRVASALEPLARVVARQGRHAEALPLWGRALAIREQQEGAQSPTLAPAITGLASSLGAQGKLDEAEAAYWRVIALQKKALGASHAEVQKLMDDLGRLYQS